MKNKHGSNESTEIILEEHMIYYLVHINKTQQHGLITFQTREKKCAMIDEKQTCGSPMNSQK